jgi:hypothetical protein
MLQQPLAWQLPPVGLAWLRASPKSEMATQLAAAMRQVP